MAKTEPLPCVNDHTHHGSPGKSSTSSDSMAALTVTDKSSGEVVAPAVSLLLLILAVANIVVVRVT